MYVMKLEELKGRGKIRTHSGLFSMGALAIALSACGSTFELADKDAVVPGTADAKVVAVTFTDEPKTVSTTTDDYAVTGAGLTSVSLSAKVVTFTFDGTANKITVKLKDDKASSFQDHDSKDYALNLTIDNQAPSAASATADKAVVTVVFDEKITSAVASKFTINGTAATSAVLDSTDTTGKTVKVTFAADASGTLKIEEGAVEDNAASGSNTENLQNKTGNVAIDGGVAPDTTPPALASTDDLKKDDANKVFTVTFNEAIDIVSGKDTKTDFILKKDGTAVTDTYTVAEAATTTGNKAITLTFTTAQTTGAYTLEILTGAVADEGGANPTTGALTTTTAVTIASLEDDLIGLSLGSADSDYGL